ncbi:HPr family phosphocarrier protein [Microbacterium sediminis]|uniref:Phosphocarrier protein HPr n=1 Tax=Microbacterium sediminis TaxID=904291 RepID=A0A1B9NCF7_9MICO|nr:HPr family phosphocarrier protein [Microbacterium sediminis]OCG74280.1 hypothetical protein A7J15_05405 [Microbacterium sediminis]QBR73642.1 HPr family phosphocarrier protein [Microbacterium sediminis]
MQRIIVVTSPDGLHARPAAQLAQLAREATGTVRLGIEGCMVDAASVLAVMDLELTPGTRVVVEAEGEDAPATLDAVAAILAPPA